MVILEQCDNDPLQAAVHSCLYAV